jgi:hypothetical protein
LRGTGTSARGAICHSVRRGTKYNLISVRLLLPSFEVVFRLVESKLTSILREIVMCQIEFMFIQLLPIDKRQDRVSLICCKMVSKVVNDRGRKAFAAACSASLVLVAGGKTMPFGVFVHKQDGGGGVTWRSCTDVYNSTMQNTYSRRNIDTQDSSNRGLQLPVIDRQSQFGGTAPACRSSLFSVRVSLRLMSTALL